MSDSDSLLPTVPETPSAKAAAEPEPLKYRWARVLIVDGLVTAAFGWAAYTGLVRWEDFAAWVAVVVMGQAKPNGSTVETAVKALGAAFTRRG